MDEVGTIFIQVEAVSVEVLEAAALAVSEAVASEAVEQEEAGKLLFQHSWKLISVFLKFY